MSPAPVKTKSDTSAASRKTAGKDSSASGGFNAAEYFKGVRSEWTKITWPSRQQVLAETGVVIVVVAFFSFTVFLMDKIYQFLITLIT